MLYLLFSMSYYPLLNLEYLIVFLQYLFFLLMLHIPLYLIVMLLSSLFPLLHLLLKEDGPLYKEEYFQFLFLNLLILFLAISMLLMLLKILCFSHHNPTLFL